MFVWDVQQLLFLQTYTNIQERQDKPNQSSYPTKKHTSLRVLTNTFHNQSYSQKHTCQSIIYISIFSFIHIPVILSKM